MTVRIETANVYYNTKSRCACVPLLVEKPGPALFRFTVYFRPVNKYAIKYQYQIPNVDKELTKVQGLKYFCDVSFVQRYSQIPLEE